MQRTFVVGLVGAGLICNYHQSLNAQATAAAESRFVLTQERLAAATTDTRAVYEMSLIAGRANRGNYVIRSTPEGEPGLTSAGEIVELLEKAPFDVRVMTPYARAAFTAADARRRYAPAPVLSAALLNADGIVVSIGSGSSFLTADSIQNVVLSVDGGRRIIQPKRTAIESRVISNALGAKRTVAVGAFYFQFEDFERLPVAVFCVGAAQTFRLWVEEEDLVR